MMRCEHSSSSLITNGARGQAAVWARGQRQLNRSHFAGAHATYAEQRERIQAAVGNYSFYIYAGGAFDAITTALPQQRRHYKIAEELVEVWVHRALLNDKRRTTDPEAASLFFVPAYRVPLQKFRCPGPRRAADKFHRGIKKLEVVPAPPGRRPRVWVLVDQSRSGKASLIPEAPRRFRKELISGSSR